MAPVDERHPRDSTQQPNILRPIGLHSDFQPNTRISADIGPRASTRTSPIISTKSPVYSSSSRPRSYQRVERWPPRPYVQTLIERDDHVPYRGTINQEPILVEVENQDRRYVLVNGKPDIGSDSRNSPGQWRPERRRPVPISVPPKHAEDMTRRQASPYAFVGTPERQDSGIHGLASRPTDRTASRSRQSSPGLSRSRVLASRQEMDGYTSMSSAYTDESDMELKSALRTEGSRRKDAHVRFNRSASKANLRTPPRIMSTPLSSGAAFAMSDFESSPSHQTSCMSEREPRRSSTFPPTDQSGPSTRESRSPGHSRSNSGYNSPSRSSTASYVNQTWANSSPNHHSPAGSIKEHQASRQTSPASSRTSSPTFAPQRTQSPSEYSARPYEHKANQAFSHQKVNRPTPLSTSTRQQSADTMPQVQSPRPIRPKQPQLPYPVEDGPLVMPHEGQFQAPAVPPHKYLVSEDRRPRSAADMRADRASCSTQSQKETTSYRRNGTNFLDPSDTPVSGRSKADTARSASVEPTAKTLFDHREHSRKGFVASDRHTSAKNMPDCPRQRTSRKYGDWHTLVGDDTVDVCPSCIDNVVMSSKYRHWFVPAPPYPTTRPRKCDFGTPWMRAAWARMQETHAHDVNLLYEVASIIAREAPCPEYEKLTAPAYGVEDSYGSFIPGFAICKNNRKLVEVLYPALKGALRRMPTSSSRREKLCTLREDSPDFYTYHDVLGKIDNLARRSHSEPDLNPLQTLIRSRSPTSADCTRDTILCNTRWHYMPDLPECTVCEECFGRHVLPLINRGSSAIALQFYRSPRPLATDYSVEPGMRPDAATCQIYSPRMQRLWQRAAKHDDLEYLRRKIEDRRRVEAECRRRQGELLKRIDRGVGSEDKQRIKSELKSIEQTWAEWE